MFKTLEKGFLLCCLLVVLISVLDVSAQGSYYIDICDKNAVVNQLNTFEVKVRDYRHNLVDASITCWTNAPGAYFDQKNNVLSWKPWYFTKGTFEAIFTAYVNGYGKLTKTINISTLSIEYNAIKRNMPLYTELDIGNDRIVWRDGAYVKGYDITKKIIEDYFYNDPRLGYDSLGWVRAGAFVTWMTLNSGAIPSYGIYGRQKPGAPLVRITERKDCWLFDINKNTVVYKEPGLNSPLQVLFKAEITDAGLKNKQVLEKDACPINYGGLSGDNFIFSSSGGVYVRNINNETSLKLTDDGYRPDIYLNRTVWVDDSEKILWFRDLKYPVNEKISENALKAKIFGDKIFYMSLVNRKGLLRLYDLSTRQDINISLLGMPSKALAVEKNRVAYLGYDEGGGVSLLMAVVHISPAITYLSSSITAPGKEITINGRNFGFDRGSGSVFFTNSNQAALIVSWDDDRIRCIVPDSAVTGYVKVQTENGESNSLPITIKRMPPSAPVELKLAPARSPSIIPISIQWKDTSDNEKRFKIYRAEICSARNQNSSFELVGTVIGNVSADPIIRWTDRSVKPSTAYYYKVTACNDSGETKCVNPEKLMVVTTK